MTQPLLNISRILYFSLPQQFETIHEATSDEATVQKQKKERKKNVKNMETNYPTKFAIKTIQ